MSRSTPRGTLTAFALLTLAAPLAAQGGGMGGGGGFGGGQPPITRGSERVFVVPGERHGPSAFPLANYDAVKPKVPGVMDFLHYHTREEIEWWMHKWADEHPEFVDLYEVGTSFGGVPILQMTLTNKSTGRHADKPAAFFEGGRHSGEITSTESVLWLMWHLIESYGKDADITRLIDEKAIHLRPVNNPDGSDMYRLTAQTNRSSVRPQDNDGDGLFDEDPGEDLDGDGFITSMRQHVGAGNGTHVIDSLDPKGRLMRAVGMGNGDYRVYPEGIDNDGDGRYNEDGIGGLDLHRNYPYNWRHDSGGDSTGRGYTQFGAGEYPLSEPETRSVVLWLLRYPNISVSNSMDTSVPMHLRGPSTCEETECVHAADLALLKHMDSVGLTITQYPWAGDVYRTYATRGGGNPSSLFGHGPDWGYFQYGAIWYGDELWNGGRERDYDGDGRIDQYEVLRFCDEEYEGKCFLGWNKVHHPQLGEVEIGGMNPKFWSQNGPPEWVEKWAKNQALFNLYMAMSLPTLEITGARVTALQNAEDGATHEVQVTVRNSGRIPTALEQAKQVKIVRPDMVTARFAGAGSRVLGPAPQFWLGGNDTQTITLRIVAGDTPASRRMTLRLSSTRGGIAEREVTF